VFLRDMRLPQGRAVCFFRDMRLPRRRASCFFRDMRLLRRRASCFFRDMRLSQGRAVCFFRDMRLPQRWASCFFRDMRLQRRRAFHILTRHKSPADLTEIFQLKLSGSGVTPTSKVCKSEARRCAGRCRESSTAARPAHPWTFMCRGSRPYRSTGCRPDSSTLSYINVVVQRRGRARAGYVAN
jgi:hypothetical protein